MTVNEVSEIPKAKIRTFYPWKELTEVGMSFTIDSPNVRQLVYAANKAARRDKTGVKYKMFREEGVVKIFRVE